MPRKKRDNSAILDRIRAKLAEHDLSANAAGAMIGRRDIIRDMERFGSIPSADRIAALAKVLGTTSDWLMFGGPEGEAEHRAALARTPVQSEVIAARPSILTHAKHSLAPLPLLGTALAGDTSMPESHLELVELNYGEVLDYLERPPSLAGDKDAYALTILSDSMFPRLSPGERVAVSPRAPVSIGDDVVVQLKGKPPVDRDDPGADRIQTVLVKRLVRRTASHLELLQFKPEETFKVPIERVAHIHKVSGILF